MGVGPLKVLPKKVADHSDESNIKENNKAIALWTDGPHNVSTIWVKGHTACT